MSISHRHLRKLGIILAALGTWTILVWGVRVVVVLNDLKSTLDNARVLMTVDNPLAVDPDEISEIINSSRESVEILKRNTAFVAKITPLFSWVPKVGLLLGELPDLIKFADLGTHTAADLWLIAHPLFLEAQEQGLSTEVIIKLLTTLDSKYSILHENAQQLVLIYDDIEADAIPWRYREFFVQLGQPLSLYENSLNLADDIPELIGMGESSTYLVLALNEDELRGSGGFITGVGELEMRDGKIASMEFSDSYSADDFSQPYPDPPVPLSQFMAIDLWVFRDSNWSGDFPTSAKQAISFYRPADPVTPIGVISIDQFAAERIVNVVGPLKIAGNESPVTGETLVDYMRNAWAPGNFEKTKEWVKARKSFMGDITKAALKKIESGSVDWTSLFQTGIQLIEQRHIQVYIENEDVSQFLRSQGWDSSLILPSQDLLTFVESNVGYNKASTRIERSLSYSVDLSDTPPTAEVILSLRHRSQNITDCTPEVRIYPTYVQSMERCYWTYFRFYVPEASLLLNASEHPIDANHVLTGQSWPGIAHIIQADEGATTVFEQALLLPTAASVDLVLNYSLPESVIEETADGEYVYRLNLQKQAGLRTLPTIVQLRVPHNALISLVHPEAHTVEQGVLIYDIPLKQNMEIELHYTLSRKGQP